MRAGGPHAPLFLATLLATSLLAQSATLVASDLDALQSERGFSEFCWKQRFCSGAPRAPMAPPRPPLAPLAGFFTASNAQTSAAARSVLGWDLLEPDPCAQWHGVSCVSNSTSLWVSALNLTSIGKASQGALEVQLGPLCR